MTLTVEDLTNISELVGKEMEKLKTILRSQGPYVEGLNIKQVLNYYKGLMDRVLTEEEYYRKLQHKTW